MNDTFKVERMKKGSATLLFVCFSLYCLIPPVFAESKWDAAGDEVSEAAKAVTEASKESWNKTKDASSELWQSTKEKSSDLVETSATTGENAIDGTVEVTTSFWQKTKDKTKNKKRKWRRGRRTGRGRRQLRQFRQFQKPKTENQNS